MQRHLSSSGEDKLSWLSLTLVPWMSAAELQFEVLLFCISTVSVSTSLRLTWLPSRSFSFSLALPLSLPPRSLLLSLCFVTNGDGCGLKFASSCFLRTSYILHDFHSPELGHCSFWHEAWCSHLRSPVPMATMRPVMLAAPTHTFATEQWIFTFFFFDKVSLEW